MWRVFLLSSFFVIVYITLSTIILNLYLYESRTKSFKGFVFIIFFKYKIISKRVQIVQKIDFCLEYI